MSVKKKQIEELELAKSFQGLVPELAGHSLANADPPEPDIVATKAGTAIGIELTQMRGFSCLSVREAERARVLERASRLVRARTGASTAVRVDWELGTHFHKEHREALAEQLASFVERHMPADGSSVLLGPPGIAESESDDPRFPFAFVLRVDSVGENDWASDDNWSGSWAEPAFVQAHIARKDTKPANYRGRYQQRWLLLVHEGYKPSSGYDLSEDVRKARFRSAYDRVFVFSLVGGKVTELLLGDRTAPV